MKKAKHKGGIVPLRKRKVEVDYYPSEGEDESSNTIGAGADGKRTAKMYDLMVPAGMKIKAYSRQEEEQRKKIAQLAKYGHSMEEIFERLPHEPLDVPGFEDL
jgi:hypothetical protein